MEGIVFDIQRFALHDGPGIRTVIFLKGCPFECVWCCNPESIALEPQLSFEEEKCNNCLQCIDYCPTGALKSVEGNLSVTFDLCDACGKCIAECPKRALKLYGYQTDTETMMATVMKDFDYYRNSGGGLTLSGGDALFQFDFAIDLLRKAKTNGLNTCIETEGYGTTEQFLQLLPIVDYFYFDYKITDPFDHERYTGVAQKMVLENLKLLAEHNAHITLRCVVIPDINDNDEHFKSIAALSIKFSAIRAVELLAYHDYGSIKYKQIGKPLYPIDSSSVTPEVADAWVKRIREFGCRNITRG